MKLPNKLHGKYISSFLILVLVSFSGNLFGQDDFPVPDAYYLFDEESFTTVVKDGSGNGHDGYWYNYRRLEEPAYAGYAQGKFGQAALFTGFHNCCPDGESQLRHSSALDFILLQDHHDFATHELALEDSFVGDTVDDLYSSEWSGFTISYWYKSIRDYEDNSSPCEFDATVGSPENETHVSIGRAASVDRIGGGIGIRSDDGLFTVKVIGEDDGSNEVTAEFEGYFSANLYDVARQSWQHVALTLDPVTKELTFYLDGKPAIEAATPFPTAQLQTNIDKIALWEGESVEVASTHVSDVWFTGLSSMWFSTEEENEFHKCVVQEDIGKLRTAFPFAGYLDEMAVYKDVALTQEQINTLKDNGLKALLGNDTYTENINMNNLHIYPNPSNGLIEIYTHDRGENIISIKIFNILGHTLETKSNINQHQLQLDCRDINPGIYFLEVHSSRNTYMQKIKIY